MRKTLLVALIATMAAASWAEPNRIADGTLEINGTTLYYTTMGSGDPIVVLHGGPGFDHRQFLPYIWELAADHKVILYDQRGTGLSSGSVDAESISIDTFVADLDGVRTAFGIEKMNLLGHSWGGILAMYYGIRHPENLRSLVLCSTAASVTSFAEMRANYEAKRLPEDRALLLEIYASDEFKANDPQAVERFWRVYFKPYFVDQSLVSKLDLHFTENTIANSATVADLMLQSLGEFDLHDELKAISCPTLVLHGESDPMPVSYAERIHRSIPGSELVIAANSGHWLFVDATATFTSSVRAFLARVGDQ